MGKKVENKTMKRFKGRRWEIIRETIGRFKKRNRRKRRKKEKQVL